MKHLTIKFSPGSGALIGDDACLLTIQANGQGFPDERCELCEPKAYIGPAGVWWGFDMRIPEDFPIVAERCIVWQIKTSKASGGSPFLACRITNGRLSLTGEHMVDGRQHRFEAARDDALPPVDGMWRRWLVHVCSMSENGGMFAIHVDGVPVSEFAANLGIGPGTKQWFKFGPYRDSSPVWGDTPTTLEFRDFRRGLTMREVC